jgi:quercetin dioxygenase-like cupin family protein
MKTLFCAFLAIGALALNAAAEEPKATAPQAVRTLLEKHDQSGVEGKEIVIGTAAFPAGASIGFHTHPGDEAGLVMKGSVILKTKGQADRTIKMGESFFNARGAVHSVVAGPDGGTVVSTWIVDKGQPMATPVP